ncbi:MAG: GTPase-associated system all-helical protein GASH [Pedobacter sp.]
MYWGLPVVNEDSRTEFIKAFKEADLVFPVSGNDHLLQVLAGILICFQLEEDFQLNISIALAIKSINFLEQYEITSTIPVMSNATTFLREQASILRETNLGEQQTEITDLTNRSEVAGYAFVAGDHFVLTTAVNSLFQAQKVFSEETNILWWLFGEASQTFDQPFKAIGLPKAIPIIAKEIFDIIEFSLSNRKIDAIINKAISNCVQSKGSDKAYSPFDMISKFDTSEITPILSGFKPETEFTPILTAFSRFITTGKSSDWANIYTSEFNGGDLKKTFQPPALASQILQELFLLHNLN